jgi:hypothetical protein
MMQSIKICILICVLLIEPVLTLFVPVPIPELGAITLCNDNLCFEKVLQDIAVSNEILVTLMVSDFRYDPYIPLYLGWIVHIFEGNPAQPPHVLLMVPSCFLTEEEMQDIDKRVRIKHADVELLEETVAVAKVHHATVRMLLEPKLANPALSWVFVSIEHGSSSFGMHSLSSVQDKNSHLQLNLPKAVMHLNHERPWIFNKKFYGYVFNDLEDFRSAYGQFPLVLRNYYYEPLSSPSSIHGKKDGKSRINDQGDDREVLFVPVGPPYYGYMLSNSTNRNAPTSPAASRANLCYFAGRSTYRRFAKSGHNNNADKKSDNEKGTILQNDDTAVAGQAVSSPEQQRQALFSLLQEKQQRLPVSLLQEKQQRLPGNEDNSNDPMPQNDMNISDDSDQSMGILSCDLEIYHEDKPAYGTEQYLHYLEKLSNTVFALCPPGNNPETFRIYEALESGAIPIIIRPSKDIDFTVSSMWGGEKHVNLREEVIETDGTPISEGENYTENMKPSYNDHAYPGPIFTSWEEVDAFLVTMSTPDSAAVKSPSQETEQEIKARNIVLNKMQEKVVKWYALLKRRNQQSISLALKRVFDKDFIIADLKAKLHAAEVKLRVLEEGNME